MPNGVVTVVSVQWFGTGAVELTYKDAAGKLGNEGPYRDRELDLETVEQGRLCFDGDGALFRLTAEARRIHLAHLFQVLCEFQGTVKLDSGRAGRDAGLIADEVIAHTVGQVGAEVTVTLHSDARLPSGASDQLIRTVTKNSRTLKFSSHGFGSY